MSYLFDVGDETVWMPDLRLGALYAGMAETVGTALECPTGLIAIPGELYQIDVPAFEDFVRTVLAYREQRQDDLVDRLLDGVLPISVLMLERCGVSVEGRTERERRYLAEVSGMHLRLVAP
ncbi:hypothetical protein J7W19_09550 [Streptomyces mobaraensis NBRC 13819 = DSM 40847]|uniref:Uncharacterized protein n=1 Tax=Streptomyces mobaraensis (strain ATCC 29032 / DSM 40847 / JCM 4168 / NBRC 13819 / NCIMB 11159 / IPCR 16-22) TaxID=1223523 RepID=M3C035_STRM1|nr:DUF6086 family protein [Streptomyces mobaraensis]EME97306.1 hypothetical protein H340_27170 [Streptomyces mobaraensis NBRC 13819 = DSM 40847]QTT73636.1 hypothetical protein J7W19_09550 [Streptomyces mobaraensis NBRC 13819 = DSM 40847]